MIARHVSTLKSEPVCSWCHERFQPGEQIIVDIYSNDSSSEHAGRPMLECRGTQVSFERTNLIMIHAKRECLEESSAAVDREVSKSVHFVERQSHLALNDRERHHLIHTSFMWSHALATWFRQFIAPSSSSENSDCVKLTVSTSRPRLTGACAPSFLLQISTAQAEQKAIRAILLPRTMTTPEFLAPMFARVYAFNMDYEGEYQPIRFMRDTLFKQCSLPCPVDIMVYTQDTGSSGASDHASVRLCVLMRMKPHPSDLARLSDLYAETSSSSSSTISMADLKAHADVTRGSTGDAVDTQAPRIASILRRMHNAFRISEQTVLKLLSSNQFKIDMADVSYSTQSFIQVRQMDQLSVVECMSNCHRACNRRDVYFMFQDTISMRDAASAVVCASGVLKQNLPMTFTDVHEMLAELQDAELTVKQLPGLAVVFSNADALTADMPAAAVAASEH